jgi:hypothetical protein
MHTGSAPLSCLTSRAVAARNRLSWQPVLCTRGPWQARTGWRRAHDSSTVPGGVTTAERGWLPRLPAIDQRSGPEAGQAGSDPEKSWSPVTKINYKIGACSIKPTMIMATLIVRRKVIDGCGRRSDEMMLLIFLVSPLTIARSVVPSRVGGPWVPAVDVPDSAAPVLVLRRHRTPAATSPHLHAALRGGDPSGGCCAG